jgi:hypothetical protein
MSGRWMDEKDLPGFKDASLQFMRHAQQVSEQLMACFARGLGFPDDYFVKVHDVSRPDSQTVARLLHYFETPKTANGEVWHRAGAHTDWDLLTLLFQKAGQSGLEVRFSLPLDHANHLQVVRSVRAAKSPPPSAMATHGPRSILIQIPMPSSATSATSSCHGVTIDSNQLFIV